MNNWMYASLILAALLIVSNVWWLSRVLTPIQRLALHTTDLAGGNLTALQQTCGGIREVRMLKHSMASMAAHVARAQEERYVYHNALMNGQEAERAHIARELHDDTVQSLIVIAQSIDLACTWLQQDSPRAIPMLKTARTQAVEVTNSLRGVITNLRPPLLDELGLTSALQMLIEQPLVVPTSLQVAGVERRLNESQELTLFRCVQEAVRNAQRHSGAKQIKVRISYQPEEVHLTIADDGRGFQVPASFDCLGQDGHYGLLGMYERVHILNGTVHLRSDTEYGTQVTIMLPLELQVQPVETVRDPVCGTDIQPQQSYGTTHYEGQNYYFCCPVCQGAFSRSPETYLTLAISQERVLL